MQSRRDGRSPPNLPGHDTPRTVRIRVQASDLLFVIGVPAAALAIALFFGVVVPRVRRVRQRRKGITLAAFVDPTVVVPPRPTRPPTPEHVPVSGAALEPLRAPAAPPRGHATSTFAPPSREAAAGGHGNARPEPVQTETPVLRLETSAERQATTGVTRPPALMVHRPMDGTLQFLPGRLEIIDGRDIGQEVRFVRQPGVAQTEVTFGRQDGAQYRHVQLHEPTVSRLHASMTLEEDGQWRLTNLSRTNPASVNGTLMGAENGSVLLNDGDRIELGEVIFRFRAK